MLIIQHSLPLFLKCDLVQFQMREWLKRMRSQKGSNVASAMTTKSTRFSTGKFSYKWSVISSWNPISILWHKSANLVCANSFRCGHMCTCLDCAQELQWSKGKCPICSSPIIDVVKAQIWSKEMVLDRGRVLALENRLERALWIWISEFYTYKPKSNAWSWKSPCLEDRLDQAWILKSYFWTPCN